MNAEISDKLRDIHLPDGVSWWPLGPGWWLLFVLALVIGFLIVWRLTRNPQMRRLHHTGFVQAQALLENLYKQCKSNNTPGRFIREYSILMRRIILHAYPRSQVSSLTGSAWLLLLDEGLDDKPFSTGAGRCLLTLPYQIGAQQNSGINVNLEELYQVSLRKLKQLHRSKTHV